MAGSLEVNGLVPGSSAQLCGMIQIGDLLSQALLSFLIGLNLSVMSAANLVKLVFAG